MGDMVYGRWHISRFGLWEMVHQKILFTGDGTVGDMVYGDGTLGEMVYEMVHQERWLMGRCYIRRDGLWEMVHEEIWIMGDGTLGEMVHQER